MWSRDLLPKCAMALKLTVLDQGDVSWTLDVLLHCSLLHDATIFPWAISFSFSRVGYLPGCLSRIYLLEVWDSRSIRICLCHFSKRCPQSFGLIVAGKKTRGLAVLLGVSREPIPRPVRGWVADLFCVETRGVGRGDFVTLIRLSCQKEVQSQRILPAG